MHIPSLFRPPSRAARLPALVALASALAPSLAAQQPVFRLDTLGVEVESRLHGLGAGTRSVQILDRSALRGLPVRSVADLLRLAGGVEVLARSPAQADLSIRGSGFEQVLVLVDGVRMSDPQSGHFDLDLAVPLERVERVEILRGPASALYGPDAMGGVVNVVTRSGAGWEGRLEAGSDGGAALGVAGALGEMRFGGGYDRSDGHRPGTDHEIAQAHVALRRDAAGGRLEAQAGAAHRAFGALGFYAPEFPAYEETTAWTGHVAWASARGAAVRWAPRVSYRRHDDLFLLRRDDPSFYRNDHVSTQVAAELTARATALGAAWAVGVEGAREALESTNLGDRAEHRGAAFAEAAFAVGSGPRAPRVLAGARADAHQAFGTSFSPSLSAALPLARSLRLRAALGRSYRAPTWTERYYTDPANVGSPDLDPEVAWSGEVGAEASLGGRVDLAVTAWGRRTEDLIDWARAAGDVGAVWETRNVVRATFRGLEGSVSTGTTDALALRLDASLIGVRADVDGGLTSKYALRPLTRSLRLDARRALPAGAAVGGILEHARRRGDDAFTRLDARGSLAVLGGRLRLDVRNVADAAYRDPVLPDFPAPGRSWSLGFSRSW